MCSCEPYSGESVGSCVIRVVRFLFSLVSYLQIATYSEHLVAVVESADEGFVALVRLLVGPDIAPLGKGFAADAAGIRFLSSMEAHVCLVEG